MLASLAMELSPCSVCHRHVRIDDAVCPFCAAKLAPRAPRPPGVRAFTRAALFAGALAVPGCAKDKTEPPPETVEPVKAADAQPAPTPIDAAPVVVAVDSAPPDANLAAAKAAAEEKARKERLRERRRKAEAKRRREEAERRRLKRNIDDQKWRHAKPYGAPPNRDRNA